VDITLMALTKHVGGHSDLMMGSASAGAEWYDRLRRRAQMLGNYVSPDDAALACAACARWGSAAIDGHGAGSGAMALHPR
jgi:tRNA A58 N-methylase Trm61